MMTSETEALKTNEFLRRRKLRLQQVREQSKDIAKKIRQRAKVEKLRHNTDLDPKKEKEYLHHQEQLVKRLEDFYARGLRNVGASHRDATELTLQDIPEKEDLSKLRGKEATAELRKKKQEKLDEQKKVLDRKLQARKTANEISLEKSSAVSSKLITKSSSSKCSENAEEKTDDTVGNTVKDNSEDKNKPQVVKSDMATQWDFGGLPNEWEPHIPELLLPNDNESLNKNVDSKSENSKILNLFAVSDEMPSSLRGGLKSVPEERRTVRPSLTLVSEYLQNRSLRLRETDTSSTSKRNVEDLHSIKQTILKSRATKPEGKQIRDACHVADVHVVPVPSWQAETNHNFCTHVKPYTVYGREFKSVTNSEINEIFRSIRPVHHPDLLPTPVLRGTSPFRRSKVCPIHNRQTGKGNMDKSKSSVPDCSSTLTKKTSVTMYNHTTRDTRDIPCSDKNIVVRDLQTDEDAYSQAVKETSTDNRDQQHNKRLQSARNKIAMTKQNVEKEYKDTMAFLSSMPKDKPKPIKNAFLNEQRQQLQKDNHQRKLQQEYKKIEREYRHTQAARQSNEKSRSKSKSPQKLESDDDFNSKDYQYTWMPVPESDGSLAIHTIPTTMKEGKSGNTVKFSKVDSYHEYRSRHKHTPPTKDTNGKQKTFIDAMLIDETDNESTECSSIASDTSSVESSHIDSNKKTRRDKHTDGKISDAKRFIIYKVMDSKLDKRNKAKMKTRLLKDITKSLNSNDKESIHKSFDEGANDSDKAKKGQNIKRTIKSAETRVAFERLSEGIYKTENEKGDNITAMYFSDKPQEGEQNMDEESADRGLCSCGKVLSKGTGINWQSGDEPLLSRSQANSGPKCAHTLKQTESSTVPQSTATSSSSFKTATNYKVDGVPDGDFIKLIDKGGHETGKFYVGATGFLKDDDFEVMIQLRKKDSSKHDEKEQKKDTGEKLVPIKEVTKKSEMQSQPGTAPLTDDGKAQRVTYDEVSDLNIKSNPKESINQVPQNPKSIGDSVDIMPEQEPPSQVYNLAGKGEYTSDQFSYGITRQEPVSERIPRPATSTYTQTTLDSPNQRPAFIHISSSTSTAYMSPPEYILPSMLRHRYKNYDETSDQTQNSYHQESIEFVNEEYCEEYAGCTCRRCSHARRITITETRCNKGNTRPKSTDQNMHAPPNSARSTSKCDSGDKTRLNEKGPTESVPKKLKKKCYKCDSRTGSKNCCKNHNKTRRNVTDKKTTSNNFIRVNSILAPVTMNRIASLINGEKGKKSKLNPVVKWYVDKLLGLNRAGLKAVEVLNQDCSSVTTPSSSIIEVPHNIGESKPVAETKISLEQIKTILSQQIIRDYEKNLNSQNSGAFNKENISGKLFCKKKSVHKVKSFNVSKHLKSTTKGQLQALLQLTSKNPVSYISSPKEEQSNKKRIAYNKKSRSKSSPSPRKTIDCESRSKNTITDRVNGSTTNYDGKLEKLLNEYDNYKETPELKQCIENAGLPFSKGMVISSDSEPGISLNHQQPRVPLNISTQTSTIDNEIQFMKLAEDKLQNMEKIADLTEKCTRRLSNLAKVLEEVRRNKSLAYSRISDSASDSDRRSDIIVMHDKPLTPTYDPVVEKTKGDETNVSPMVSTREETEESGTLNSSPYIQFLTDIPKPDKSGAAILQRDPCTTTDSSNSVFIEYPNSKTRSKPPTALSRLTLKHGHDAVVPHELSTVVEVDSPLSVKLKNQSTRLDTKSEVQDSAIQENNYNKEETINDSNNKDQCVNPDLVQSNINLSKRPTKISSTDSDDSKIQMMDLKQFNEIMLKPFISIQEYAKQCNLGNLDEGSNLDDIPRDVINDDVSSLHSDGSLPDVIAELLKRNIISEPFKFGTVASNVNSTTASSESVSTLALSKIRKEKRKSNDIFQNKENIAETSDTLSISSNPDLEIAFKQLGMGWASSTLKKTKERLALSSSSNTSSSSLSRFQIKSFNQEVPVHATDYLSALEASSYKRKQDKIEDHSKNVEQQTSLSKSMTVKQFLRNELAKKITFTSRSLRDDTEEEFISLYETKIPEEMKRSPLVAVEERSIDGGGPNTSNNRARTSTPVQIFKSMAYHSSSSSNMSNGLFSNIDDLSSVKGTSNSMRNSTSEKDDLTIPNCSLKMKKALSDCSKSE